MNELHADVVRILKAAAPHALPEDIILSDMRRGRHRMLALPQLQGVLRDLTDKAWITTEESSFAGKRWRITNHGVSSAQEEGL